MSAPAWRRYLRFWGRDIAADVDDELAFHLDSRIREYIASGMSAEEARAAATARFGDMDAVRTRVERLDRVEAGTRDRADWWGALRQDLRYGLRTLVHAPGFTLVAVLTLIIGIGANTAIFSVVRGVLLQPLPFHEPDRLVRLFTAFRGSGEERYSVSQPEFLDYKGLTGLFENVAAYIGAGFTLDEGGNPERITGMAVTREYFPVLGVGPARGRLFQGEEGRDGVEPVVILTHELWTNRFGGDATVLDRTLQLNGVSRRVIGILPPGVALGGAQAYIPMFINPDAPAGRAANYLSVVARLKRGVILDQAAQDFDAAARTIALQMPEVYPAQMGRGATMIGMQEEMVGDARPALMVLLGAVTLILLIACANVANLLLARGEARQREIALRLALGAGRGRLLTQLLTESLLLALAGAVGGLLLAAWGIKALLAVSPDSLPRIANVQVDLPVALVTLGLALAAAILFGLMPALQVLRPELHTALKESTRGGSTSGSRLRLGRVLVSAEIALAVIVVIGASLLVRSFEAIRQVDPGFRTDHLLAIDMALPRASYDGPQAIEFYRQLMERLAAIPGVERVGAASDLPPSSSGENWDIDIAGVVREPGASSPAPHRRVVSDGYFSAMEIPLRVGRLLEPGDGANAPLVAVINEAAARHIWPGSNPVGQRVRFSQESPWITIVGVVGDVHSMGLTEPAPAELYLPYTQVIASSNQPQRAMFVVARTTGEPAALTRQGREAVRALDPALALNGIWTMDQMLARSLARPRFTMTLLGIFGAVALVLAAIGVYGLLAYTVHRRTREIGIRMALGARASEVLGLVVGQGLRLALAGVVAGVAIALLATRLMVRLLYGVSPADPVSFVVIPVVLLTVAVAASLIPARRATRADPALVLRSE